MDLFEAAMGFSVVLVLGLLGALGIEHIGATTEEYRVTVIEQLYTPKESSVTVAPIINPSGNTSVMILPASSGPTYELLVQFSDGHRDVVDVDKEAWVYAERGSGVSLTCKIGRISNKILKCHRPRRGVS